jgi:hypothetical protein
MGLGLVLSGNVQNAKGMETYQANHGKTNAVIRVDGLIWLIKKNRVHRMEKSCRTLHLRNLSGDVETCDTKGETLSVRLIGESRKQRRSSYDDIVRRGITIVIYQEEG